MIRDIGALNEVKDAASARFFAGGPESASHAKSLRKQPDGNVSVIDGPYLVAKEHIGGFWILQCAEMDEALAWGRKAVVARQVLSRCERSSKCGLQLHCPVGFQQAGRPKAIQYRRSRKIDNRAP